jgi:phage gp29-like protein
MQIFWPYTADERATGGQAVERIEPSSVGLENFMKIIDGYFGGQIKRVIAGQDLTSESNATGLGSGLSQVHENTFMRLVKLDAINLDETLTHQMINIIHKYSYPEDRFRLKFVSSVDRPDPLKYLEAAEKFKNMGGTLDEDEVRSVIGFTKPDADSTVLGGAGGGLGKVEPSEVVSKNAKRKSRGRAVTSA